MRVFSMLVALSLLAVVPVGQAQESGLTWYLNDFTSTDGAGAHLSILGPANNAMTSTTLGIDPREFSFTEKEPGFAQGYTSLGGDGEAVVYVKSWNSLPAPQTKVDFTIKVGDVVVGSGSQTKDVLNGAIVEYKLTFPYEHGDIAAGDKVTLEVKITTGPTGDGNPAFYPRGDSENHWRVALPVVGIEAAGITTVYEDLNATELAQSFENATSDIYLFNFTNELSAGLALFSFNVTAGNATVLLLDAAGAEIANTTVNATADQVFAFENATAGLWNLSIAYTDFTGSVSFSIQEPAVEEIATPEVTGNATTNETLDGGVDEQEAPGAALPLLLVGLIALVRRRK